MKRKIYDDLLEWKNNKDSLPLILLGVRQCGKTYILDEFCRNEYKDYVYINLFDRKDIVNLYESDLTADDKFSQFKALINLDIDKENTILFIDEIQESTSLISNLKYISEKHSNARIVCAGSLLGIRLKNFDKSFPVGKVRFMYLYPMDFEEFLYACDEELLIKEIKKGYNLNVALSKALHDKALNLYKSYLITGGMPDSIKNLININFDFINYDKNIIKGIVDSYFEDMNHYVANKNESMKIKRIYNSLPSQLANNSNKFQFSKVEKGGKARDYMSSLDWLLANNMVIEVKAISNPEIPLKGFVINDTFKLFLSDVGVLNNLLDLDISDILTNNISLYKGVIAENYVANQLSAKGHILYYWRDSHSAEVDFIIKINGKVIPVEVKANDNKKSKSLNGYIEKYKPSYSIRISSKNFGFENGIKSVPLYAVFCL